MSSCGTERTCIGHEITEVIELIPVEVVVRRDLREKLACDTCEPPGAARDAPRRRNLPAIAAIA